ncbi:MAG: TPM domain-containing protein [Clostridia bacterium]|nr:TPM domain-containing protein [Clostridia bacterium]
MKRLFLLLLSVLLCLSLAAPVFATEPDDAYDNQLLIDDADLFSDSEEKELNDYLYQMSRSANAEFVVLTVDSIGSVSADDFANEYYDDHDYGYGEDRDGVILLIAMESRDVCVSTNGNTYNRIKPQKIRNKITPYLSDGDYYYAVEKYAALCEEKMTAPLVSFRCIPISLLIGFLISLIITSAMKGSMKSVTKQFNATSYVRDQSMQLSQSQDTFLYMHLDRVPKPTQSSNSGGGGRSFSSGGSHHSSSGKF